MFDKMKDMMEMKKQADQIKRQLDSVVVDCEDVSGIKIQITGSQQVQSIEIDDKHIDVQNKVRFQRNLVKALNAATKKSQKVAAEKMRGAIPGM